MNWFDWLKSLWPWPRPGPSAPPAPARMAEQIVAMVNAERGKIGLPPLTIQAELASVAGKYAATMARRNVLSHYLDGNVHARLIREGYHWTEAGENIAQGSASAQEVVAEWMGSPMHRANVLNGAFVDTGAGVADGGKGPYVCQVFGRR